MTCVICGADTPKGTNLCAQHKIKGIQTKSIHYRVRDQSRVREFSKVKTRRSSRAPRGPKLG